MERTPVKSSSIASIGRDEASGETHVEFHSGAVYSYPTTRQEHEELINASSIGRHFAERIRKKGGTRIS